MKSEKAWKETLIFSALSVAAAAMSEEMARILILGYCSCSRPGPVKAHILPFSIAYYDGRAPVSHYFHPRISPDVILEGIEVKEAAFCAAREKTRRSNRERRLIYLSSVL